MSFDALTLAAVRDELDPVVRETRIQKLIFIDELSIAMEVFAPGAGRGNVLLSADLDRARVHRLVRLPTRGLQRDTPFSLVVRKHLRNAHIRSLVQPRLERVLEVDCEQRDESGQHYRVLLIVEAMGRRSNLVLVDGDGMILDAARRTPPSRNPRRPVLPHLPYAPPPPQSRLFPEQITPEALATAADAASQRGARPALGKVLADTLAGLSPLAGREIAFRALGDAATLVPHAVADFAGVATAARELLSLVDTHQWSPTLALDGDRPVDYAPYRLTHLAAAGARLEHAASISAAIQAFHERPTELGRTRGDSLAAERKALLTPIDRALESIARRIAALEHQLDSGQTQRDPLRRAGDLILIHQLDLPLGSTELDAEGEHVELDPTLNAIDNSQAYFARYRKARDTEERVPELLETARQQAEHLTNLRTLVDVADGMDSVRALRQEVGAATKGIGPAPRQKPAARGTQKNARTRGSYRRVALADDWEALVGTSSNGNATVTFDLARAGDLWLHARGVPGAHVIVRGPRSQPPQEVVERAAQLAAWHSANRASGAVEVDVAPRQYVKKIPNGPPGLVRYSHERTVRVTPKH